MSTGEYRTVARVADGVTGVSVLASQASDYLASFVTSTFFLSWNNDTVKSLVPCESSSRVQMTGVWASNWTGTVTFHLRSSWPAKLIVDFMVLIDANVGDFHRTATFSAQLSVFYEIRVDFTCISPSTTSTVSLE